MSCHHCNCHSSKQPENRPATDDAPAPARRAGLGKIISALFLLSGWLTDCFLSDTWSIAHWNGWLRVLWFFIALLPVCLPVLAEAWRGWRQGDYFNEFTLMAVAAIGAFAIGEYPEAVAVMLFYAVGEYFQEHASERARNDIRHMVELHPGEIAVEQPDGTVLRQDPEEVPPGSVIRLEAGRRVPLDGLLLGDVAADFDTSALTGESVPRVIEPGHEVLAGMLTVNRACRIQVKRSYSKSALAHILKMVNDAAARKAPAERFIRRFARIYTPAVIAAAVLMAILPPWAALFTGWEGMTLNESFHRALVFLVASCPCALVISIPLAYFSGLGFASRRGILFKGGNYLDALSTAGTVIFDKTGTLTCGRFKVTGVECADGMSQRELLRLAGGVEQYSTHPLAHAVADYVASAGIKPAVADTVEELPGRGLRAAVDTRTVLVGSRRLLEEEGVPAETVPAVAGTDGLVMIAIDKRYAGSFILTDMPKHDAAKAVRELRRLGVKRQIILSGDRQDAVRELADRIGITEYRGDLLPEQKLQQVKRLLSSSRRHGVAFVGDGINDAPALALSDIGIAMGNAGNDVAVETADVVVRSGSPAKVAEAVRIARRTRHIVRFNITLSIAVKAAVLLLGGAGLAPLWLAVLADTGVALLCVLNVFTLWR